MFYRQVTLISFQHLKRRFADRTVALVTDRHRYRITGNLRLQNVFE